MMMRLLLEQQRQQREAQEEEKRDREREKAEEKADREREKAEEKADRKRKEAEEKADRLRQEELLQTILALQKERQSTKNLESGRDGSAAMESSVSYLRADLRKAEQKLQELEYEREKRERRMTQLQAQVDERLQEALSFLQKKEDNLFATSDELKQAKTKAQECQARLDEAERELLDLRSRYTAQVREIDRLQTEVQERSLTASQQETMYMADREEEISRLNADINMLHEKLSQNDGQLLSREDHLRRVQGQLREMQEELAHREAVAQKYQMEAASLADDRKRLGGQISKMDIHVQRVETDLQQIKGMYKDAVEENGRLEARVQAQTISANSEQEVLSVEVQRREETITRLKLELVSQRDVRSKQEEKITQLEREIEQQKVQLRQGANELDMKESKIRNLEGSVEELKKRNSVHLDDISRLEDKLREASIEQSVLQSTVDKLQHNIETKEDLLSNLRGDLESLHHQQKETMGKVLLRDENIARVNSEIAELKAKHQEKMGEFYDCTKELQNQSELIKKLQDTLTQCHLDLEQTRKRAEDETASRDERIQHLGEDFMESQSQYSNCYNEALKTESELERVKAENAGLGDQVSRMGAETMALREQLHQLELDLTISQEKHRTCQQEVAARDQVILRLQTDLDTAQQEYNLTNEELGINAGEVTRLQNKIKEHQGEIRNLNAQLEEQEHRITGDEKIIQQLQHDQQIALQECFRQLNARNHLRSVEQLRADLSVAKTTHNQEVQRLHQDTSLIKEDLGLTRQELNEAQSQCADFKCSMETLNQELDRVRSLHEDASLEVKRQSDVIRDQDESMSETRQQLVVMESQLEEARNEGDRLEAEPDAYKQKYDHCLAQIAHLEGSVNSLQDKLADSRNREVDKESHIESLKADLDNLERQQLLSEREVAECEEVIEQLTAELNATQEDLSLSQNRVRECEENIKNLKDSQRERDAVSGSSSEDESEDRATPEDRQTYTRRGRRVMRPSRFL